MSDSILTTIKQGVGVAADDSSFDTELMLHINGCFPTLAQLKVGPQTGFMILSADETWGDYLGDQKELLQNAVTMYIILKTKLNFDPPDVGFVITSMERQLTALEGRLLFDADKPATSTVDQEEELAWVVSSAEPLPTDMEVGELAIDPTTGDVWSKR